MPQREYLWQITLSVLSQVHGWERSRHQSRLRSPVFQRDRCQSQCPAYAAVRYHHHAYQQPTSYCYRGPWSRGKLCYICRVIGIIARIVQDEFRRISLKDVKVIEVSSCKCKSLKYEQEENCRRKYKICVLDNNRLAHYRYVISNRSTFGYWYVSVGGRRTRHSHHRRYLSHWYRHSYSSASGLCRLTTQLWNSGKYQNRYSVCSMRSWQLWFIFHWFYSYCWVLLGKSGIFENLILLNNSLKHLTFLFCFQPLD